MLNLLAWIGRFLLSSKTVTFGIVATVFNWVIKSKVFWCSVALYTSIRAALFLYKFVVGQIVSAIGNYSVSSPSGSVEIFAMANRIVPIDEVGVGFVMLGTAYALRFGVRWLLTAYKIVPFKAT